MGIALKKFQRTPNTPRPAANAYGIISQQATPHSAPLNKALIWLPSVKLKKASLCCTAHEALLQRELGDGAGLITTVDHADIRGLVTA